MSGDIYDWVLQDGTDKPMEPNLNPVGIDMPFSSCPYDADYYMNGKESGKSLYVDYKWLPNLTHKMVRAMIGHLGIKFGETVLDFGCGRGYTVRAFLEQGFDARGVDLSPWAIENCDPEVKWKVQLLPCGILSNWIIAKDVLEHVADLQETINALLENSSVGIFVVVPLSLTDNGPYVVDDYERDITHLHRLTLPTWAAMFMRPGWSVTASYRMQGIKDNYSSWERGNGFIVAKRIK